MEQRLEVLERERMGAGGVGYWDGLESEDEVNGVKVEEGAEDAV